MKNRKFFHRYLALLLILLFLLMFSSTAFARITPIPEARNSVLRVIVFESETGLLRSMGTGFIIGTDEPFEYVVTNLHVANPWLFFEEREDVPIDIYVYRSRDDLVPVSIYHSLPLVDMALLRIDPDHLLHGYETLALARRDMVEVNDPVVAIGFPVWAGTPTWPLRDGVSIGPADYPAAYPQDTTVTAGIISKHLSFDGVGYYQSDAATSFGSSGGPLLNKDGQVVGINTWRMAWEDIYGAFQIDYLVDFLISRNIGFIPAYAVDDDPPPPPADEIGFIDLPASISAGDDFILQARVVNRGDEPRDLRVDFYVNGNLIATETASQVNPDQGEVVSTPWSPDTEGNYGLRVTSGDAASEQTLRVDSDGWWPPFDNAGLIIGLVAAALLLIVFAIVLVSRSRKPAVATVSSTPTPSAQQATLASGPVTRTKPEGAPGAPPAVTQARRQQLRPVIKGVSGFFAGQTLELVDNQLTIGRDPRLAQLVYPQQREEISRKHLTIRFDEKTHKFNLTDSSSNGTFLSSNQKLEPGEAYYLNSGDRFYLAEPNEVFEVKVES